MPTHSILIRAATVCAAATFLLVAGAQSRAGAQTLGGGARAQLQQACGADVQRLCNGVQPGGGRIAACLKQRSDRVSSPCMSALSSLQQGR